MVFQSNESDSICRDIRNADNTRRNVYAAGSYSVVISNAYGSTNSAVATLTVVTPLVTSVARNANGSVTLNFEGLPNTTTRIWATTNLASRSLLAAYFHE